MSQSSEQAEKMGCKKCGGIKRHAESCKLNTWFLTDPPVPSMVRDDERGSRAQSSEQGASGKLSLKAEKLAPGVYRLSSAKFETEPERIFLTSPEASWRTFRIDGIKQIEYTRSDICASLAEALERIINELPAKRDWLDPDLEKFARTALAQVKTDDK